jgi:hypothetical protein
MFPEQGSGDKMKRHDKGLRVVLFVLLIINLGAIDSFCATNANVNVTVTILAGESSIFVNTDLVNFGTVSGSVSDRRFIAGPIKVSYFPGASSWTVRVYTANPGNVAGLIGASDPNEAIPLKVWCANYGPTGNVPDEENAYFWNGYDFNKNGQRTDVITDGSISEIALGFDVHGDGDKFDTGLGTESAKVSEEPVWLRVPDMAEMIGGQPYTWRRLCYAGADLDPDGFPVFFGIDVFRKPPQVYSTAVLTFQIINE